MNRYLILGVVLLLPQFIFAYNPILNTTTIPYEPFLIDGSIEEEAQYLGTLIGDPHMYEFAVGKESLLKLSVLQKEVASPLLLSLIAVKENTHNAGVTEVGRVPARLTELQVQDDSVLGMTFLESQFFTATLTPGTYRVEVSTPDNYGKYMLSVGTIPSEAGYFATLGHIRVIQKFFDRSIFALTTSVYVIYPVGSICMLLLLYVTWRKRGSIQAFRHG